MAGGVVGFSGYATMSAIVSNWWLENRTTMIAIPIAASTIGCSVYQYVGGILFSRYDVRTVFFCVAMFSAMAGLITNLTLLRHVDPKEIGLQAVGSEKIDNEVNEIETVQSGGEKNKDIKSMYKSPVFWLFMFGAFTDATSVSYITMYCTVFFTQYGMKYTTATTLLSGLALGSGIFGFVNGRVMEKLGAKSYVALIYISAIVANVSMIIFQHKPSTLLIVIMVVTYILGYQCGTVGNLLTREFCKSENAYNGNTKYIGTMLAGGILFMPMFGVIVDNIGFTPMFVIISVGCFLSLVAYLLAMKMVEKNGKI